MTIRNGMTILDVAREAGVSRTTASSALSGSGRISEDTRERVREVAERLGFVANTTARNLRTGRTGAIGIYLEERLLDYSFYMEYMVGIATEAMQRDYALTLISGGLPSLNALAHIDGVIIGTPIEGDPMTGKLLTSGLPVVCSERCLDAVVEPVATIETDYVPAEYELLDHLCEQGARNPALLSLPVGISVLRNLVQGYRDWCKQNGVKPRVLLLDAVGSPEAVVTYTSELLVKPNRPDAILAGADDLALSVFDAARSVGADVLIASCVENNSLRLVTPGITSIVNPPRDIGRHAASVLLDVLDGRQVPKTILRPKPQLALRRSTTRI